MNNEQSIITGQSGDTKQPFIYSKDAIARRRRKNYQMVQNVLLIWLNNNIDDNSTDCRNNITQL